MDKQGYLEQIGTLFRQRHFSAAHEVVTQALDAFPNAIQLQTRHAIILREIQRLPESIAILRRLVEQVPKGLAQRCELAVSLRSARHYSDSLCSLQSVLGLDPAYRPALWARVVTLAHAAQFDTALEAIDQALHHHPDDLEFLTRRGVVLRERHQTAASVALLSDLCDAHPDALYPRHELSMSLRAAGAFERSLALSDDLLAEQSNYRSAHWARIVTNQQARRLGAAHDAVMVALQHYPNDMRFLKQQGVILREVQRPEHSVSCLSALASRYPSALDIQHELSLSLRATGAHSRARAVQSAVLALDPLHRPTLIAHLETLALARDFDAIHAVVQHMAKATAPNSYSTQTQRRAIAAAIRHYPALVTDAPWLWNYIQDNLAEFSGDDLLIIHDAYALHWGQTQDASHSLMQAVFAQETLSAAACVKVINILHLGTPAAFDTLAQRVISRAPPGDQGYLRLYVASISAPASEVLRARKALVPGVRPLRTLMLLTRLLRQDGRLTVALRFWRRLRVRFPQDMAIRQHYLNMVLVAEDITAARAELSELADQIDRVPLSFAETILRGFITIGDVETAHKLYCRFEDHISGNAAILDTAIRIKQGVGRLEDAQALFRLRRRLSVSADTFRAGPTIVGVIQNEYELSKRNDPCACVSRLTANVPTLVRRAVLQPDAVLIASSSQEPPRSIHQYWDKAEVPEDLQAMIATWKNAPFFTHHLYDKRAARRLLREELGEGWVAAFNNASSAAEESDFFRLCILMLRGGLYVDCDDLLCGDLNALHRWFCGFTVFAEPLGHVGNNFIAAPRGHRALKLAAIAAKTALQGRHNDNTWFKTGPGLLSRIVAEMVQDGSARRTQSAVTIYPRSMLPRYVQMHVPLPYKRTGSYWNSGQKTHAFDAVLGAIAG